MLVEHISIWIDNKLYSIQKFVERNFPSRKFQMKIIFKAQGVKELVDENKIKPECFGLREEKLVRN